MPETADLDLPAFYAAHLSPGMIDLSTSSPHPLALRVLNSDDISGAFLTPQTSLPLRLAIASRYTTLGADDILLCSGAGEALAAIAYATLTRGDIVAASPSTYPSLCNAARHLGASIVEPAPGTRATLALLTNPDVPFGDIRDTAAFITDALSSGALPLVDEV
ncbi:MAG: aminotransferase class I/II-fold pyridoxal phosphate-dependent enzyme, partial [Tepidiformaceae bacterium]